MADRPHTSTTLPYDVTSTSTSTSTSTDKHQTHSTSISSTASSPSILTPATLPPPALYHTVNSRGNASFVAEPASRRATGGQASPTELAAGASRPSPMAGTSGYVEIDAEGVPITYTPTTHRISKAKKGKKVHVCEYGCGKVFTRAEHRKRHEANHRPDPLFRCTVEECQKPFQRIDLLNRHLERQHGIQQPPTQQRGRTSSVTSSVATSAVTNSPALTHPVGVQPIMEPHSYMGVSSPSGLMSIGSIIEPPVHHSYPQTSWNDYQMQPLGSRHLTPDYPYTSSSTEPPHSLYSSDGGYSPASDSYNAPAQTSYMPLHDRIATSYASEYPIPPVPMPASGPWTHQPGEYPQSIEGLGIEFSDQCPPPVGISRDVRTMNHCILTGTPGQTTSTSSLNVGPGFELRAKHSLANELVSGNLVDLDGESLRHYDNCFWDYVDPLFPIIHRPTYMAATCGFLSATVFALGAQFSPRPQARAHSLSWFMIASEHCAAVDQASITSQTQLTVMQAIALLEYLALFRSRNQGVHRSQQFSALYTHLLSTRNEYSNEARIDTALIESSYEETKWLDLESRKRILLASFIVDTLRKSLFQHPLTKAFPSSTVPELPGPSVRLWGAPTSDEWRDEVAKQVSLTAASLPTTAFETAISICMSYHANQSPPAIFMHSLLPETLQVSANTPLHSLLLVAASSWLFARKSSLNAWSTAKVQLRSWSVTPNATIAAWWAGRVLRSHFQRSYPSNQQTAMGLEVDWSLYMSALVLWAFAYPTNQEIPEVSVSSRSSMDLQSAAMPSNDPSALQESSSASQMQPPPQPSALTAHNPRTTVAAPYAAPAQVESLMPAPTPIAPPPPPLSIIASPPSTIPSLPSTHTPPTTPNLHTFLAAWNTSTYQDIANFRGSGSSGVESVLGAVAAVLQNRSGRTKGALLGEALGVLERLKMEWRRSSNGAPRTGSVSF